MSMELSVYIVDDDKTVTNQLSEIIKNWAIRTAFMQASFFMTSICHLRMSFHIQ